MTTRRRSTAAFAVALSAAAILGACGSTATTTSGSGGTGSTVAGPEAGGVLPTGGAVEIKGRADQQPGVELRGLDVARLEQSSQCAPRRIDRKAHERLSRTHAAVPCSAS